MFRIYHIVGAKMNEKFDKEKELWNKIHLLREEMVRTAYNKKLDFLDEEVYHRVSFKQTFKRI